MDNIGLLAKAIGTTADKIILPEGEDDLTDYIEAEFTVRGSLSGLKHPDDHIAAILETTQRAIGSKYRILLMYVGEGSIRIGIKIHAADAMRFVKTFIQGELHSYMVQSVFIKSSLHEKREAHYLPEYVSDLALDEQAIDERKELLERALRCLTSMERKVIKLRYALTDGYIYTHKEIGAVFKKTAAQIRAIERKALGKIKKITGSDANIFAP